MSLSLDEAIHHLDEVLSSDKVWSCEECKQEHIQLREWLKELREYRRIDGKQSDGCSYCNNNMWKANFLNKFMEVK